LVAPDLLTQELAKEGNVPLTHIAVGLGHLAVDAIVIDDLISLLPLAPLGETALLLKDGGDQDHSLGQRFAHHPGRMLPGDSVHHLAEEEPFLLRGAKASDLVALQGGHLLQEQVGQAVIALGKEFVPLIAEAEEIVGTAARAFHLSRFQEVIPFQGG